MILEIDLLAVGYRLNNGDDLLMRYGNLEMGEVHRSVILIHGGYKKK